MRFAPRLRFQQKHNGKTMARILDNPPLLCSARPKEALVNIDHYPSIPTISVAA
jgi:hypothetical protein